MQIAVRSWSCRRCGTPPRWHGLILRLERRPYSSASREYDVKRLKVVCGSSGSIDVDIHNAHALTSPKNPLILYLPQTGIHLRSTHPSIPPYLLHPSAALARVNYRWNIPPTASSSPSPIRTAKLLSNHPSFKTHPFPTPLHDTLHAYTYLLSTFLPRFSPPSTPNQYPSYTSAPRTFYSPSQTSKIIQRPILVYGDFLGGTIATSLALTESFASKQLPSRIAGLIARNGIYNWTNIATSPLPPPRQEDGSILEGKPWDATTLHALKETLFSSPASTFDSFASPVLFFRTSGLEVPKTWPSSSNSDPDTASPSSLTPTYSIEEADIFYPTPDPSLATDINATEPETADRGGKPTGDLKLEATRRAHLKHPPKNSGLAIPRSLFLYSSPPATPPSSDQNAKSDAGEVTAKGQAEDVVKLMRRSILLHEFKDRVLWDEEFDPSVAAEERVQLRALPSKQEREEGDEGRMVRGWIDETLDT